MSYKDTDGHALYKGRCNNCGFERIARYYDLRTTSKCNHIGFDGKLKPQHNTTTWENKRIQRIFAGMKDRCYNKNDKNYRWYGAKGIKICDEWLSNPNLFEEWSMENSYDDTLTIDRINSDEGYSPENCRWVTIEFNGRNNSNASFITINDETHTGREWSRNLGLGVNTINTYIRKYGLDNTIEFMKRYMENPNLKRNNRNQSIYSLYMNSCYVN